MGGKLCPGLAYHLNGVPVNFAAVYVIGSSQKQRPVNIGYTRNPDKTLSGLQSNMDEKIEIFALGWAVSWNIAVRLKNRCHRILDRAGKRINEG